MLSTAVAKSADKRIRPKLLPPIAILTDIAQGSFKWSLCAPAPFWVRGSSTFTLFGAHFTVAETRRIERTAAPPPRTPPIAILTLINRIRVF